MLNRVHSLTASWPMRVLLFSGLAYTLFSVFFDVFPAELLVYQIDILAAVLIATFSIELLRISGGRFSIGLGFDRTTPKNIMFAVAFVPLAVVFFLIASMLLGSKIEFIESVSFSSILNLLLLCICIGAWEELLFRGLLLRSFISGIGEAPAIILISLAFAYSHNMNPGANPLSFLNVFLAGILFSLMYIKTKSLWMPIVFHSLWNFSVQFLLSSPISGFNYDTSLLNITIPANQFSTLLFGGAFGVEGGIVCTVVLTGLIAITPKLAFLSPFESSLVFKQNFKESELANKL